jgi:arginine exporter protein ArgO
MNDLYFIQRLLLTLLVVLIIAGFYWVGKSIANRTRYTGSSKLFLTIAIASLCALIVFYTYSLGLNLLGFGNEYLTVIVLWIGPLALIFFPIFALLFLIKRKSSNKNP